MSRRLSLLHAGAVVCGLLAVSARPIAGAHIAVYSDPSGPNCSILDTRPGLLSIYILVVQTAGVTSTRFQAPLPECIVGATYLSDTAIWPSTVGDSQTGIEITLGACVPAPLHVLTINFFVQGLTAEPCCYPALAHPSAPSGEIEFLDCASNTVVGGSWAGSVSDDGSWAPPRVTFREPADGATELDLDTDLSWNFDLCSCGLGSSWSRVYFGTSADPPLVTPHHGLTYDPGLLQPSTTYFWKITAVDSDAGSTTTPVWSFTTESGVPVESSTWGTLKHLFSALPPN